MNTSAARFVGALLGAGLLAGCAQVPHAGPVVEATRGLRPVEPQVQYVNPKGPQPGQAPSDVVTGFLVAMTATPLQTTTAGKFLSNQARAQWQPERVVTYSDRTPARGIRRVVVQLQGADQVGVRGEWQGQVPPAGRRLVFPMRRENNEWRIARVPDALIVPRSFYDQQFQDAQIYFFDPSGRRLVPEPVHVPQGSQLASSLVRALVRGPSPAAAGVERTFLPPGLTPVLSVPVGEDGVANVTLKGPDPGPLSQRTTQLILGQFAWTLRQDPSVTRFRLSIAGHQVADATGAQIFRVDSQAYDRFDAFSRASSQIYALREGRLVSGQIDHPTPVDGPFGNYRQGIGPFAVSLDGTRVAGVTSDALLVGPVAGPSQATPVLSGTGLLRPSWDFADRLWNVQRGPHGAVVVCVEHRRRHQVRIPGITGENVRRFLVSRDGSRLVALLRQSRGDRIVVSRLRYNAENRPVSGTRARLIPWLSSGTSRVRDIGWTSPTTIAVLDQFSRAQAESRILNVDGSTPADQTSPTTIPGRSIGLATSPVDTPYAVLPNSLYDLSQLDSTPLVPTRGLRHITYAG
ncbi:MAG: GerMN domain-containing protein [Nocardioides sp.]|nr:GerMN domain-containing protein [Nocardioides sp.]